MGLKITELCHWSNFPAPRQLLSEWVKRKCKGFFHSFSLCVISHVSECTDLSWCSGETTLTPTTKRTRLVQMKANMSRFLEDNTWKKHQNFTVWRYPLYSFVAHERHQFQQHLSNAQGTEKSMFCPNSAKCTDQHTAVATTQHEFKCVALFALIVPLLSCQSSTPGGLHLQAE